MNDLYKEFCKKVRDRRNELGVSKTAVSKSADIVLKTLLNIEREQVACSLKNALKLAKALEFSLDELLEYVDVSYSKDYQKNELDLKMKELQKEMAKLQEKKKVLQ